MDEKVKNRLLKYEENWHDGITYKFQGKENKLFNKYKTVIAGKEHLIYDEIIKKNDIPILYLNLYNNENKSFLKSIIYLEDDMVIQQISKLSYEQFRLEIANNQELNQEFDETENTTIIKTPFLDFIKNVNKEEDIKKEIYDKKWKFKKIIWNIFCVSIFLIAWCSIPVIGNLIIAPLIVGFVSSITITWLPFVGAGLIAGGITTALSACSGKIKKLIFPKTKNKHQIELEEKLKEQKKILDEEFEEKLFLNSNKEAKEKRILNAFHQIWKKDQNRVFDDLQKELNKKFDENKYSKQIENWNTNWDEKVEFTKFLEHKNIREIKEIFIESKKNNSTMCAGFFYQPKALLEKFQEEKILEDINKLWNDDKNVIQYFPDFEPIYPSNLELKKSSQENRGMKI